MGPLQIIVEILVRSGEVIPQPGAKKAHELECGNSAPLLAEFQEGDNLKALTLQPSYSSRSSIKTIAVPFRPIS